MLRPRNLACAWMLGALLLSALACGGDGAGDGATDTGAFEPAAGLTEAFAELEEAAETMEPPSADVCTPIEVALVLLNREVPEEVTISAGLAEEAGRPSLCSVGFEAERPDYVLVTLVTVFGSWTQIPVSPLEGVDWASIMGGGDFRDAGIDGELFSGYRCRIVNDQVVLVGG